MDKLYDIGDRLLCDRGEFIILILEILQKEYKAEVLHPGSNSLLVKGQVDTFDKGLNYRKI